jgi:hypothetical protein
MNRDFAEMLNALADESVEYLVVGAYAVAGHGIGLDSTKDCRKCTFLESLAARPQTGEKGRIRCSPPPPVRMPAPPMAVARAFLLGAHDRQTGPSVSAPGIDSLR